MKKILVSVFFAVMVVLIAYAIVGCELETVTDEEVCAVDVVTDTTDGLGVDVYADITTTVDCGQFFNHWQCFCQAGLCSGDLWKTVVPCEQGNCAVVTDVTEVDGKTYIADCADIGQVQDDVLHISTGEGAQQTTYLCVPASPP